MDVLKNGIRSFVLISLGFSLSALSQGKLPDGQIIESITTDLDGDLYPDAVLLIKIAAKDPYADPTLDPQIRIDIEDMIRQEIEIELDTINTHIFDTRNRYSVLVKLAMAEGFKEVFSHEEYISSDSILTLEVKNIDEDKDTDLVVKVDSSFDEDSIFENDGQGNFVLLSKYWPHRESYLDMICSSKGYFDGGLHYYLLSNEDEYKLEREMGGYVAGDVDIEPATVDEQSEGLNTNNLVVTSDSDVIVLKKEESYFSAQVVKYRGQSVESLIETELRSKRMFNLNCKPSVRFLRKHKF